MSDNGMCCAQIRVATRAYVQSRGYWCLHPFLATFILEDGSEVPVHCDSIERVRVLVRDLSPQTVTVDGVEGEDTPGMLAIVIGAAGVH